MDRFMRVGAENLGDGGTVRGVIIGSGRYRGDRVQIIGPHTLGKAEHFEKTWMRIVANDVSTDVAQHDPTVAEGPVEIKPNDDIRASEQIIHPPNEPPFRHPSWLRHDLPYILKTQL